MPDITSQSAAEKIHNHRCAAILVFESRLLTMFRRKNGRDFFVLVGGHMHKGETQEETLRREVMEEASITIRNPELAFEICDFRKNKHEHYYLCEYNSGTLRLGGEESERNCPENFYQLQWIPLQEVAKINLLPMAAKEWILETLINPSNIPVHTPPPARDFRPD